MNHNNQMNNQLDEDKQFPHHHVQVNEKVDMRVK